MTNPREEDIIGEPWGLVPPEIQETLDKMATDPNWGTRRERPQRKRPQDWPQPVDEAEIEDETSDEESYTNRHWLLITGLGLVALGLIVRWWYRRR